MRLLVDTHALIWFVDQDHLLSQTALSALSDPSNELLVSAGSIWEISIKVSVGKLTLAEPYGAWMRKALFDTRASLLPITVDHAEIQ